MTVEAGQIKKICDALHAAQSVLFITGAGISAESGLPTYRGIGGLYEGKVTELNKPIEEVLSGEMMRKEPAVTWQFIGEIEASCRGAKYNRAHQIIAEFEKHIERCWVLTQNIDGFHRDAGSENIIDIHGDIHHLKCTNCDFTTWVENYASIEIPPKCDKCQSMLRPDVVLFGEMLPEDKMIVMSHQFEQGFDVVFSIGTTSVFPYIAMPVYNARLQGGLTIEINPAESEVSQLVDIRIQAKAGPTLEEILNAFQIGAKKSQAR